MSRGPRDLRGKRTDVAPVVLVVGASSGIGRAVALALARRGTTLVLASRSAERLDDVAARCRALARRHAPGQATGDVVTVPVDVADADAVRRLVEAAWAVRGRVDAVVHTPAVVAYGRFEEIPGEVFDQVVRVNLLGAANVARLVLPRFARAGGGHLVLVGSLLGSIATPWMSPYVTSKWGLRGLVRTLQAEVRSLPGVDVSLVSPGGVDTPVYAQAASFADREGRPPPPVDRPETVARAVLAVLARPRRERSVGLANVPWTTAFRVLPGVYDTLVGPAMSRLGLSRTRVEQPHLGNVFAPVPEGEALHGKWGRHWLRWVTLAAGTAGVAALARALRAARA